MIKNIMKNIGVKPAEVKEKPKNLLPSGINADDVSTEDLQSYMQSIQENIDSMPTEEEMKNSKIDFSLRKSQLGSKKKELEALRKVLIKRQAEEKPQTSKTYIRKNADGSYAPYMSTPQGELMIPGAHTYSTEKGAQQALNKFNETHNIESNAMQTKVSKKAVLPGNSGLKKLAEQNEKFLNRRDELIAKGKLTEKEAEEMKNLTNIIQMNTSAMLNLTGDNKEKKPLTSPDLIPSYDDFNPYRD